MYRLHLAAYFFVVFLAAQPSTALTGVLSPSNPVIGVTNVTLSGTATPNATVTDSSTAPDGTTTTFNAAVNASGNYSFGPFKVQQIGTYTAALHDSISGANQTVTYSGTGDFGTSVNTTSQTVTAGQAVSFIATFTSVGGFSGTVTPAALNWGNIPGATASWSPASVIVPSGGSAAATFTIQTAASTTAGTYGNIILYGQNGAAQRAANAVSLTVSTQAPAVTISSINPSSPTVSGSNQTVTVNGAGFQNGLTVTVFFPGGGSATLSGTQIQGVSAGSFQMIATLNVLGQYGIQVNNPNGGGQSGMFNFSTENSGSRPTITSTATAPQGTAFVTTGSGFMANGIVNRFLKSPGSDTFTQISPIPADGKGDISFSFPSDCTTVMAAYQLYAVDQSSGVQSNVITQTVTAGSQCLPAPTAGTIVVASNLPGAIFTLAPAVAGVSGGGPYPQTIFSAPAGSYSVTFSDQPGYTTPQPQVQTLAAGRTISFSGTYQAVNQDSLTAFPSILHFGPLITSGGTVSPKIVTLGSTGNAVPFTVRVTTTSGGSWLTANLSSGSTPRQLAVSVSPPSTPALYQGLITLSGGAVPLTIPVDLTVVEPAKVTVELLDPYPSLISPQNMQVYAPGTGHDDAFVSSSIQRREGVATDGVSTLVLRITTSVPGNVKLLLDDDCANGTATQSECGTLNVDQVNTSVIGGGNRAFATYRAPSVFVRANFANDAGIAERTVTLRAVFESSDGYPGSLSTKIKVVRPPIMLIHGLWSDAGSWDSFSLPSSVDCVDGFRFACRIDYKTTHDQKFAVNAPIVGDQIYRKIIHFKLVKNVVVLQADVIAHSMGGNIVRTLPLCGNIFLDCSFQYLTSTNLGKGLIHKLVTIGTPHAGTPIANFLIESRPITLCPQLSFALNKAGNTVGGAVEDLQANGGAINGLNRVDSPFPVYSLVGVASVEDQVLDGSVGLFSVIDIICPFDQVSTVHSFFGGNSDLIVPTSSQAYGKVFGQATAIHSRSAGLFISGSYSLGEQEIEDFVTAALHAFDEP